MLQSIRGARKEIPLMLEGGINLREAVQKKAVLKDILSGGLKEADIPNAVQTAFSDLPYANDRQRNVDNDGMKTDRTSEIFAFKKKRTRSLIRS